MSESRGFPAELLSFLLFGALGVAVTAAALAGFAQLMAGQGCSGSVVPLVLSAVWNGTVTESAVVCRILAVLLCGCIGGLLGVTLRSRRHALR